MVEAIEPVDGLDMLITGEFAQTLVNCTTVDEWIQAFRGHPEVIQEQSVDSRLAADYLAASCQLLANERVETSVCSEAEALGMFFPA